MRKTKKTLKRIKAEMLNEAFKIDNKQSKIVFDLYKKIKLKRASNKLYCSANKIEKIMALLHE